MKLRRLKKIESCGVRLATVYRNAGVLINIHEQFIGFFYFCIFFTIITCIPTGRFNYLLTHTVV